MRLSFFQKIVYYLAFAAVVLSTLSSVFVFSLSNVSVILTYGLLAADIAGIVLVKAFFILTEKKTAQKRMYLLFRENNLYFHHNYLYTVTEEINIFCELVSMLLLIAVLFFVVIYGHLCECIGALLLGYLIIFRCKYYLYQRVIGKLNDSVGNASHTNVVRGFAKMFFGEYKATGFKRNDVFYRQCIRYRFDRKDKNQHECIKRILWFDAKNKWQHEVKKTVLSLILLILMVSIVFHPRIDERIDFYLKYFSITVFQQFPWKSLMLFIMNLVFCFTIVSVLLGYRTTCQYITRVLDSVKNNYRKRCYDLLNELQIRKVHRKPSMAKQKSSFHQKSGKTYFKKLLSLGLTAYCTDHAMIAGPYDVSSLRYHPVLRFQLRITLKSFLAFMTVLSFSLFFMFSERVDAVPLFIILGSVWVAFALLCFWLLPLIRKQIIIHSCRKLEQKRI